MVRLGIVAPDEVIEDIFQERVRGRNMAMEDGVPVSEIELRRGKIVGVTQTVWSEPVVWDEDWQKWQVIDDAEVRRLWLSPGDDDCLIEVQ